MSRRITEIWLDRETVLEVGRLGVTEIERQEYHPEPYCTQIYYVVRNEDGTARQYNDKYIFGLTEEEPQDSGLPHMAEFYRETR